MGDNKGVYEMKAVVVKKTFFIAYLVELDKAVITRFAQNYIVATRKIGKREFETVIITAGTR